MCAAPDAFKVGEDVRNEGRDPSQGRVDPEVVEHVVHLVNNFRIHFTIETQHY